MSTLIVAPSGKGSKTDPAISENLLPPRFKRKSVPAISANKGLEKVTRLLLLASSLSRSGESVRSGISETPLPIKMNSRRFVLPIKVSEI